MIDDRPLYVTETECAARLGIPPERWRTVRRHYERIGLPLPDPVCGRRYWPAVRAFLDRHNGLTTARPAQAAEYPSPPDGPEKEHGFTAKNRRRARA